MYIFLQRLIKMSRVMKIDNLFFERCIYRVCSKVGMDCDLVMKYF